MRPEFDSENDSVLRGPARRGGAPPAAGVADRIEESERGVGVAAAGAVSTRSPSWRERLAAIFAPRAWRYAMPVVALVAVSAVVLVMTRRMTPESASETAA